VILVVTPENVDFLHLVAVCFQAEKISTDLSRLPLPTYFTCSADIVLSTLQPEKTAPTRPLLSLHRHYFDKTF